MNPKWLSPEVEERLLELASIWGETPDSFLRRLLGMELKETHGQKKYFLSNPDVHDRSVALMATDSFGQSDSDDLFPRTQNPKRLPDLPHHMPTGLRQVLELVHLVRGGMGRVEATKWLAGWHRVEIPTVTLKYTRQLGISAYEMDDLLKPDFARDLHRVLSSRHAEYEEEIRRIVLGPVP